jgi:hypothetical protein
MYFLFLASTGTEDKIAGKKVLRKGRKSSMQQTRSQQW